MRRSVAFSLERSAIFSALSRSLWKLVWIFLISSLLVKNWAWISAGRYSYKYRSTTTLFNSLVIAWVDLFFFLCHRTTGTNLCLGRDSVCHELISQLLVSFSQLTLDILFRKAQMEKKKKTKTQSSWSRKRFAVGHYDKDIYCTTTKTTKWSGKRGKEYIQSHWRWGRSSPARPLQRRDAVPLSWWIWREHVSSLQWTRARRQRSGLRADTRESTIIDSRFSSTRHTNTLS